MSLPICYFGNKSSSKILLLVGGSGDSKDSYNILVEKLESLLPNHQIITFSFSGVEEKKDMLLSNQIEDLASICDVIINTSVTSISLVATSNGAFSSSHIVIDPRFGSYFKDFILLDPADHYLDTQETVKSSRTWSGLEKYNPVKPTTSSLMKKLLSNVKVHVVNFTIRNFGKKGYVKIEERGIDNDTMFSRLNNDMVKSFYENTQLQNRGLYIEDNSLPHAFMRDGDIPKNIMKIGSLLSKILLFTTST